MDKDYKEEIRKLLALAESPNEHEAKAALLKARQLMAEHKLTEAELKDVEKQQVKDIRTDITCSKRRNPWIVNLSAVIGENYCCKGYRNHGYGEQTQHIGFVGLEDDVEICVAIFKYALDCILSEIKRIKKENACYYSSYVKKLCDSYGFGFVIGISAAFAAQQKENESGWGLVLVMPKEVEEATQHFGKEQFRSRTQDDIAGSEYIKGYAKGKEFDPAKKDFGGGGGMTEQRQAELIAAACKEAGLDGHIRWIDSKKQADTWAEKIAMRFKGSNSLPVKNSYMYCDTLDMCFFFGETGVPYLTYAGYVTAESKDITEGKLLEAFRRARQVLSTMKELAEGEKT